MKIFITGASGYLGFSVLQSALAKGHEVHALVRQPQHFPSFNHPGLFLHGGDITDAVSVQQAMEGCSQVFHLAALSRLEHPKRQQYYSINVQGTYNVLEAALKEGISKLVYTSSCAVFGPSGEHPLTEEDPRMVPFENDYEISKHCAEQLVKEYVKKGLSAVIVNPPRIYGPGLSTTANPITSLIGRALKCGFIMIPTNKEVQGNYALISDVTEGHFLAMEKGKAGERYILGGENISYGDFFETLRQMAAQRIRLISVPGYLMKAAAGLTSATAKVTGRSTQFTPRIVSRLLQQRAVSSDKAVQQLGYQITPFPQAMSQTIHHLKKQPPCLRIVH
jgi:nucleoside-diphosphate-sugar epimerase